MRESAGRAGPACGACVDPPAVITVEPVKDFKNSVMFALKSDICVAERIVSRGE